MFYAEKGKVYVYIYFHKEADIFYIGEHEGKNKFYGSSCTDASFRSAITSGAAVPYIVWTGTSTERAKAIEVALIAFAKDNFKSIANGNAGGGFGSVDLSLVVNSDIFHGKNVLLEEAYREKLKKANHDIETIKKEMKVLSKLQKNVVKDMFDGVENPLIPYLVKRNVDVALSKPVLQIREMDIDRVHLEGIKNRMSLETHDEWVRTTRPVSFVIGSEIPYLRVNGQHTLTGTKDLGIEGDIYCLDLPYSLFHNSKTALEVYATACNQAEEVASKSPDPKTEIRLRLNSFYEQNVNLFEHNATEFLEKFTSWYGGNYSKLQISANFNSWKDDKLEIQARGDNFIDYAKFRGVVLIDKIVEIVKTKFRTDGVTKVSVSNLHIGGFSHASNYFTQTSPFETVEVVLAYHNSTKSENAYNQQRGNLHKTLDWYDWILDPSEAKYGITPYVRKGKKIYIVELPSRLDNLQEGSGSAWATKVFNMVFNEQ